MLFRSLKEETVKDASGLRRLKSDRADASMIAEYAMRNYDKAAKNVIATRQFLAMILHERVPEFRLFPREFIERECIEGDPWVEEISVDPGQTNGKLLPQKIRGQNTEQSDDNDGYVDADDVLALLVQNGIGGDGGLAGLAVADNQLTLATAREGLTSGVETNTP